MSGRSPGSALGSRGAVLALCLALGTILQQRAGLCTPSIGPFTSGGPSVPVQPRGQHLQDRGYGSAASRLGSAEPPLLWDPCGTGGQAGFALSQLGSAALRVLLAPR